MSRTEKRASRSTAEQLAEARENSAALEARKVSLSLAREPALLARDEARLKDLRDQGSALQIEQEDNNDLIAALEIKLADEAAEQRVAARSELEARALAKAGECYEAVLECVELIGLLGKAAERAEKLGAELAAGWPWRQQDMDRLLIGSRIQLAFAHEMFRTSGRVLPGARSPNFADHRRTNFPPLAERAEATLALARQVIAETPTRMIQLPAAPAHQPQAAG